MEAIELKIYENGERLDTSKLTGLQCSALKDAISYEIDTVEKEYSRQLTHSGFSNNRITIEVDQEFFDALLGKKFTMDVPQYDERIWGEIEVEFTLPLLSKI